MVTDINHFEIVFLPTESIQPADNVWPKSQILFDVKN